MSAPQAWFCPGCHKYHGPHVDTCPEAPQPIVIGIQPWAPVREYREHHEWRPDTGRPYPPPFYTTCGGVAVEHDPNTVVM